MKWLLCWCLFVLSSVASPPDGWQEWPESQFVLARQYDPQAVRSFVEQEWGAELTDVYCAMIPAYMNSNLSDVEKVRGLRIILSNVQSEVPGDDARNLSVSLVFLHKSALDLLTHYDVDPDQQADFQKRLMFDLAFDFLSKGFVVIYEMQGEELTDDKEVDAVWAVLQEKIISALKALVSAGSSQPMPLVKKVRDAILLMGELIMPDYGVITLEGWQVFIDRISRVIHLGLVKLGDYDNTVFVAKETIPPTEDIMGILGEDFFRNPEWSSRERQRIAGELCRVPIPVLNQLKELGLLQGNANSVCQRLQLFGELGVDGTADFFERIPFAELSQESRERLMLNTKSLGVFLRNQQNDLFQHLEPWQKAFVEAQGETSRLVHETIYMQRLVECVDALVNVNPEHIALLRGRNILGVDMSFLQQIQILRALKGQCVGMPFVLEKHGVISPEKDPLANARMLERVRRIKPYLIGEVFTRIKDIPECDYEYLWMAMRMENAPFQGLREKYFNDVSTVEGALKALQQLRSIFNPPTKKDPARIRARRG